MINKYFGITAMLVATAFSCISQITITKADLLTGPDTIRMSNASIAGIPNPALTGPNYTWDYSAITPTLQYVDTFVAVTATPFLYQLYFNNPLSPKYKANFAQKGADFNAFSQIQLTNTYNYFKNSNTEYSIVGFGSTVNSVPMSIKYDSIDVVYKYPMNYGNKDSTISKYSISIPGIGTFGERKKRVNEVEGWGTVKTPFGTFNALKIKSTLYITDTLFSTTLNFGFKTPERKQYEYKWLAAGEKVPVLQIDASTIAVTRIAYRDSFRTGVIHIGINEIGGAHDFLLFPNPANENISLKYSVNEAGPVRVELLDLFGRAACVIVDETQPAGTHVRTLNTKELNIAKGIYFVRLAFNGGYIVNKLIIQ